MKSLLIPSVSLLVSSAALLVPAVAFAQPEAYEAEAGTNNERVAAPRNAFEIGVVTGYAQGGGKLGGAAGSLEDISGPGGSVEVDLGYRILPELGIGAYGTYARFANGDSVSSSTDVLGASAGVQATWHFRPEHSIDPWLSLGTGWKGLWLNPASGKVTSLQGLDLARLQLGVDYRVSKDLAIAPVVGGTLSLFLAEDSAMTTDLSEIHDKKVNVTGFVGLAGRFDLGGTR
jgi:hypothetical protein